MLFLLLLRLLSMELAWILSELTLSERESPASLRDFLFRSKAIIGLPAPSTSAPMLEQVIASSASGLFFASCNSRVQRTSRRQVSGVTVLRQQLHCCSDTHGDGQILWPQVLVVHDAGGRVQADGERQRQDCRARCRRARDWRTKGESSSARLTRGAQAAATAATGAGSRAVGARDAFASKAGSRVEARCAPGSLLRVLTRHAPLNSHHSSLCLSLPLLEDKPFTDRVRRLTLIDGLLVREKEKKGGRKGSTSDGKQFITCTARAIRSSGSFALSLSAPNFKPVPCLCLCLRSCCYTGCTQQ